MPNPILTQTGVKTNITITLASLAAAAVRQSTMINNSGKYPAAMLYLTIESGSTGPTAGGIYSIYLLRGDDPATPTYRTDNAGASDAALTTLLNAVKIGTIRTTATANKKFYWEGDTTPAGPLGPEWGIAIANDTDQTLHATEGNHLKEFEYIYPEIQ